MIEQNQTWPRHRNTERIGSSLEEWLARPDWTLEEAHHWLQGHSLPPVGHDEDAYVWILRGLLLAEERGEAEAEMARRMAAVLGERPDLARPGLRPEELLFNLLMVCAGLGFPEHLGGPLLDLYERRELRGDWMGVDLRVALTAALIPNQLDDRLLPVWRSMIDGRGDEYLIGSVAHGIDGVSFLPAAEPGEPPLDEIGAALKALSVHLHDEPDRRVEFKAYLDRVLSRYPGRPSWNEELVRLADSHEWPDWAVVSLPSLCVRLDRTARGGRQLFLWEIYLPLVKEFGNEFGFEPEIVAALCERKVFQLRVPEEAANYIAPFTTVLEQRRQPGSTPLPTYSAVFGAVTDLMSEIELLPKSKLKDGSKRFYPFLELMGSHEGDSDRAAEVLEHAHRKILPMNRAGVKAAAKTS